MGDRGTHLVSFFTKVACPKHCPQACHFTHNFIGWLLAFHCKQVPETHHLRKYERYGRPSLLLDAEKEIQHQVEHGSKYSIDDGRWEPIVRGWTEASFFVVKLFLFLSRCHLLQFLPWLGVDKLPHQNFSGVWDSLLAILLKNFLPLLCRPTCKMPF